MSPGKNEDEHEDEDKDESEDKNDDEDENENADGNGDVPFFDDKYEIVVAAVARASRSFLLFSARKQETTAARS